MDLASCEALALVLAIKGNIRLKNKNTNRTKKSLRESGDLPNTELRRLYLQMKSEYERIKIDNDELKSLVKELNRRSAITKVAGVPRRVTVDLTNIKSNLLGRLLKCACKDSRSKE